MPSGTRVIGETPNGNVILQTPDGTVIDADGQPLTLNPNGTVTDPRTGTRIIS